MSLLNDLLAEEDRKQEGHDYLRYHKRRYEFLIKTCLEVCANRQANVLDVGRSRLSPILLQEYDNVTTLGWPLDGRESGSQPPTGKSYFGHLVFDLNDAQTIERMDTECKFDLIVFAEVIEHLHTAPELVLGFLSTLLSPNGIIVCGTPNACAIHKRLIMLFGKNPYQRLRINSGNRGHIREYTREELIQIGHRIGLATVSHRYEDYFGVPDGWTKHIAAETLKIVGLVVPPARRGQTIIYKRADNR